MVEYVSHARHASLRRSTTIDQPTLTVVDARALLQRIGRDGRRAETRRRRREFGSGIWAHAGPSASAIVGAGPPWIDAAVFRSVHGTTAAGRAGNARKYTPLGPYAHTRRSSTERILSRGICVGKAWVRP